MNSILTLKEVRCIECSTLFGMSDDIYEHRLENGRLFYCPNGHSQYFPKRENELKKLKQEKQSLESQLSWAVQEAESAKREKTALKGQLTKTRNRVANGVCPCCHRTFKQLAAHMDNKHPDFKKAVA